MARLVVDDWNELQRLTGESHEGQEARLRDTGEVVVWKGRWCHTDDGADLEVDRALVGHLRHCMEVAVALIRQGQDSAAGEVLSDALNGVFHPAPAPADDEPLELAIEDETPEIPEIKVDDDWELTIDDEGWEIDPEVVDRICHEVVVGRDTEYLTIFWAENKVRLMLQSAVLAGRVRKRRKEQ